MASKGCAFEAGGSACQMNGEQQENLKAWVAAALLRSDAPDRRRIEQEFGHVYAGRSGQSRYCIARAQPHRRKSSPRKLDEKKQKVFIANYEKS
jgi:hypothetical protein